VVGRDRGDRAVADRFEQRRPVPLGAERRVHLQVRIEGAHGLVGQAQVVRRGFRGRGDARRLRAVQVLDRFAC
jgi:hypothetical protein